MKSILHTLSILFFISKIPFFLPLYFRVLFIWAMYLWGTSAYTNWRIDHSNEVDADFYNKAVFEYRAKINYYGINPKGFNPKALNPYNQHR